MRASHWFVVATLLLMSAPAWAQDAEKVENEEFNVTIAPPADWKIAQANDKAVANFMHDGSQSQIEVVGSKLMTKDVADVFFNTFHKTLKETGFEQKEQSEGVALGPFTGTQTTYKFVHSDVALDVVIYQFMQPGDDTAWLVVGYMQEEEASKYLPAFKSVVESMKFSEG